MGALALTGGPTAGREPLMEPCGSADMEMTLMLTAVAPLTTDTLTADIPFSQLQKVQAQCLAAVVRQTGPAKWRMTR